MSSIREAARKWVSGAQDCYVKDIAAMSHDLLDKGNNGRAPYDYTHEVAVVNRRVASRLRREEPGEWPFEGWAVAPSHLRTPDAISADLKSSLEEIL
ncbi:MAG: hypothetical protein KF812_12920, partial [Fimbriimonadaceae bacterium]|nr:hypothetical protein [Fimbriimonadaceae bacterium]